MTRGWPIKTQGPDRARPSTAVSGGSRGSAEGGRNDSPDGPISTRDVTTEVARARSVRSGGGGGRTSDGAVIHNNRHNAADGCAGVQVLLEATHR